MSNIFGTTNRLNKQTVKVTSSNNNRLYLPKITVQSDQSQDDEKPNNYASDPSFQISEKNTNNYSFPDSSSKKLQPDYNDSTQQLQSVCKITSKADNEFLSTRHYLPGDLTAVSSDDDDGQCSDDENVNGSTQDDMSVDVEFFEPEELTRRSMRLRRSLKVAQANLPSDFEERVKNLIPGKPDDITRCPSVERFHLSEEHSSTDGSSFEDDGNKMNTSTQKLCYSTVSSQPKVSTIQFNSGKLSNYRNDSPAKSVSPSLSNMGVNWASECSQDLKDLLPLIRDHGSSRIHFMRTICQLNTCRCLLRGHDTLMLLPIFDAILCEATWEKIIDLTSKPMSFYSLKSHDRPPVPSTSETELKLILFRHCRGWFEILNENHQPVPHWTTLEQVRKAQPSAFLVRSQLQCLLAPSYLWLPPYPHPSTDPLTEQSTATQLTFPPNLLTEAASANSIAASVPCSLKAGTLLTYVGFLPTCQLKRGRKVKQMALIVAVEKQRPQSSIVSTEQKLYYLGTEDASSFSVFPPLLAVSPVAGPENISGVHMISSILRKFRLPLSIRPVAVPETASTGELGQSPSLGVFPNIPDLVTDERHFLRLRRIYRGDILIVAPIDTPDRFFVITPTLLQDHLFQIGVSEDAIYKRLAAGHKKRTANFLSTAHTKDSLNYLFRHLNLISQQHRTSRSEAGQLVNEIIPGHGINSLQALEIYKRTGKDPRVGSDCTWSPDQVDLVYEELEDLYFFTRNGYYPRKTRNRGIMKNQPISHESSKAQSSHKPTPPPVTGNSTVKQLPSAEELLAASLNILTMN